MKIKSSLLFCSSFTVALVMSASAQAGWLDFLTGTEEAAETVQQGAQTVDKVNQAVQTGAAATQSLPTAQQSLTGILMNRLGVSQAQAEGGAGALFQVAKQRMTDSAFGQVRQAVPGMDALLAAAPQQPSSVDSLAGGLATVVGKDSAVGSAASLISAFQQLDLSQGMISQFTPIVVDYIKQQSGPELANLLQIALTGS
ncbi:DUF2780 domain-containing protein [Methylomarinum vadi]|uniref:DUF2780 domain-containing protein n=1 Tax=Methylomarinum vadi TaxID=438855 RepID=UPI00055EB429|nr:DUF2780 domain-containing protein [Methylomarinum vadi]